MASSLEGICRQYGASTLFLHGEHKLSACDLQKYCIDRYVLHNYGFSNFIALCVRLKGHQ